MRELSVYYCPDCGHYGYYQVSRNAVCPTCQKSLKRLDMSYQDFTQLTLEQRDCLLIEKLLAGSRSFSGRLTAADRLHNHRKLIASMNAQIQSLTEENQQLNDTIAWMHRTIWDLLAQNRALRRQLEGSEKEPPSDLT